MNVRRRGISHRDANPPVVVTVRCGVPPSVAQPVGGLLQAFQELGRGAMQDAPLLGQREAARPALEQGHAQVILQPADLPADRRLRDEQLLGRLGEAQRTGRRLEALDEVQRRQVEAFPLHSQNSCME